MHLCTQMQKAIILSRSLLLQLCFHYPPCPPISLVAYSAAPATTVHCTVVAFQLWCDGWRGNCRLPARPPVIHASPSVETEPGVWWHLAFYRKNYASVLTFSLMHKIHDVCGTSCRHCGGETEREREASCMSQLRHGHTRTDAHYPIHKHLAHTQLIQ